ncbi:MAG: bifunctional phosphopantothenoylcysteine decarboxylase/phosphopantothenate--cysteine ligase CoaBC [Planctomycetes bacterium]|nr:bifunctional phosphopantothenoylcysteine decarboxylase/phosphopantothenate--cysteine ligase CoaBC [Planctomycetota bacterium]
MKLKGKNILIGVTGGIAAYKAAEIVSRLHQKGASVKVVMTKSAAEFVTPLTFQTLSHNQVYTEMFSGYEANPKHISLADEADLLLVAPATANIIGKIAHGIADDLLSTVVMSLPRRQAGVKCPVLIAPAMNDMMYKNPIVQENIKKLQKLGYKFIPPEKGYLACQKVGEGRLACLDTILSSVEKALS